MGCRLRRDCRRAPTCLPRSKCKRWEEAVRKESNLLFFCPSDPDARYTVKVRGQTCRSLRAVGAEGSRLRIGSLRGATDALAAAQGLLPFGWAGLEESAGSVLAAEIVSIRTVGRFPSNLCVYRSNPASPTQNFSGVVLAPTGISSALTPQSACSSLCSPVFLSLLVTWPVW